MEQPKDSFSKNEMGTEILHNPRLLTLSLNSSDLWGARSLLCAVPWYQAGSITSYVTTSIPLELWLQPRTGHAGMCAPRRGPNPERKEVRGQAEGAQSLSSFQLLLLFHCSVLADSLRPPGRQHAGLPCSSPSPGVCSN